MAGLTPYVLFPGTARDALTFYADVFGGAATLHSYSDFGRTDGTADWIAHGFLTGSPVELFGADAGDDEKSFTSTGLLYSLLGTADPETLTTWFTRLSVGGTVIDDLQKREWGAYDGQVTDRYGLPWLIGYEPEQ